MSVGKVTDREKCKQATQAELMRNSADLSSEEYIAYRETLIALVHGRIRSWSELRGLSRRELARRAGIPTSRVRAIFGGGTIYGHEILFLSNALGVTVEALLDDNRTPAEQDRRMLPKAWRTA